MHRINEARTILQDLGMPASQCNEMSALTLLALCNIGPEQDWNSATNGSMGISKGIMPFVNERYGKLYAPNTRETFRRQVLHQFVQARIANYNPDNPLLPVNSPRAHYALTCDVLQAIKKFGTDQYASAVQQFIANQGRLTDVYLKERQLNQIKVKLSNGQELMLSPGDHNILQAAIVEKFAPRFAGGGEIVYLGDTAKKNLHVDSELLVEIGIPITQHSKLPDVVIYDNARNWLFLIEAVTSHGPVSPKRLMELEEMLMDSSAGKIYVSAFPDMSVFKKYSTDIAWETEVWLMDLPDHMIHFNGDKFLGPR